LTLPSGSVTPRAVSVASVPAARELGVALSEAICGGWAGRLPSRRSVLEALSRPPLSTLPDSEPTRSTPRRIALRTSATVALGASDHARAATPETCGVAMLVPDKVT